MKKLAIMGLGLMGGSIGLAAKKAGVADVVAGYARREESRRLAMELGVVDKVYSSAAESVESADMAVCCVPVLAMPGLAGDCKSGFAKGCIVTDVGSTKKELEIQMRSVLEGTGAVFVGSHPIAGSEMTGLSAARADLFEGAMVVVTEGEGEGKDKTAAVVDMWSKFGARVCVMSSGRHDEILAKTSHLPHLLAAGLARHVLGAGDCDVQKFCGSGFSDTTRIAAGSVPVWHDIVKTNREQILLQLRGFKKELAELESIIDSADFHALRGYLTESSNLRKDL